MQSMYLTLAFVGAWLVLCALMWRKHKARHQVTTTTNSCVVVAYASQTGNAQSIAQRCALALGLPETSSVMPLNDLTLELLNQVERVLFVVSTYGYGEAPDNGNLFYKVTKKGFADKNSEPSLELSSEISRESNTTDLSHLQYSVIALGDKDYPDFCAFGFELNQMLLKTGAQLVGEVIAVDKYDEQNTALADITPPWLTMEQSELQVNEPLFIPQYWQLVGRDVLNPGCADEALVKLSLNSVGPIPVWQAGDLIEIQPKHSKATVDKFLDKNNLDGQVWITESGHQHTLSEWLRTRELLIPCPETIDEILVSFPSLGKRSYSVASIAESGQLQLVIRLVQKQDTFGLASGYLAHHCQIGDIIQGQIKSLKPSHNIGQQHPAILIGAGSGLAGLKAQLDSREFNAQLNKVETENWLIFGERNSDPRLPINQELASLASQDSTKLSRAFSQDSQYPKYVQHILLDEQLTLKQWLNKGASIYVCGCLQGMGESVHQTLIDILGQTAVELLQKQRRYIRDIY